jgi:hypothetical protein
MRGEKEEEMKADSTCNQPSKSQEGAIQTQKRHGLKRSLIMRRGK